MDDILIIFDLDGTLIETSYDLLDSLNYCLENADLEHVEYDQLTSLVGQGARNLLSRAFELRDKDVTSKELDLYVQRLVTHYKNNMPGRSEPYPGLIDALDRLKAGGFRFAICTNKLEGLARLLMDKLDMSGYFDVITGGDSFEFRKPDARHILETINLANGQPERSIMIGDSINDILAAKNANVASIGVPFGYTDVPIEELEPDVVLPHYEELTSQLIMNLITG